MSLVCFGRVGQRFLKMGVVMLLQKLARNLLFKSILRMPVAGSGWLEKMYAEKSLRGLQGTVACDLGSGPEPRNLFLCQDYFGLDLREGSKVRKFDLSSGSLPLADASVDVFTAYDFLEHVPRVLSRGADLGIRFPFVDLMSEIYRCLKPGGFFFSSTPCYPWFSAFIDPTHVNIMTEHTLANYFCGENPQGGCYGFKGRFELSVAAWTHPHFNALLVKPV